MPSKITLTVRARRTLVSRLIWPLIQFYLLVMVRLGRLTPDQALKTGKQRLIAGMRARVGHGDWRKVESD
jgi:hypothetical protein